MRPYSALYQQFYYNESMDYTQPGNILPNGHYRDNTHPSQLAIAYDDETAAKVYVDSTPAVTSAYHANHNLASSDYSKSALAGGGLHVAINSQGIGHHWGYSTCHWIRACTTDEMVGSACSSSIAGVMYRGYCFESMDSSLQCGHTTALDDKLGNKPIVIQQSRSPNKLASDEENLFVGTSASRVTLPPRTYRCERGSAAVSGGSYVGKRLPIAGCLNTSDASYSVMADVHVPAYCSQPHEFKRGCMFPGATNFDPEALQPSPCYYGTRGCTSSTAVNYNSEASIEDGSCIAAVVGCTIAATTYAGTASDTPGYKSGFFGSARPNVGKVSETVYAGPAVLNHQPGANVLSGCVIAVEGCMDSNAVNYESMSTINSGTWCIPMVKGCMMPSMRTAPSSFNTPAKNRRDGLAINFDPAASVHDPRSCVIERIGCMDPTMNNYDPHATVRDACYSELEGCLNPLAKNFRCATRQFEPCENLIQLHSRAVCQWDVAPPAPPGPPPPPLPPGRAYIRRQGVVTTMVAGGDVTDYDEATKGRIATFFAKQAGVDTSVVSIEVTAASVILEVTVIFESQDAARSAAAQIENALGGSASSASAALGIVVQSAPSTLAKEVLVEVVATPGGVPPFAFVIIGCGTLLLVFVAMCHLRRRRTAHIDVEAQSQGDEHVDWTKPVQYAVALPPKPQKSESAYTPSGQLLYAWGPDPPFQWDPKLELGPARMPRPSQAFRAGCGP